MRLTRAIRKLSVSTAVLLALLAMIACHSRRLKSDDRTIVIRLLTAADTAPQQAVITLHADDRTDFVALTPVGGGRYSGRISSTVQRAALTVMLPEHEVLRAPIWIPTTGPAEYIVRPRSLIPVDTVTGVRAIGDFNGFREETAVALAPTTRGTLRAAVPFSGDSCRFLILGLGYGAQGAWMPVRSWAVVRVEDGQRYAGVLRPVRDSLIFEVDTSQRRTKLRAPAVVTLTHDSSAAIANSLALVREDMAFFSFRIRAYAPSDTASTREAAIADAEHALQTLTDPRVRGEALVTALSIATKVSAFFDSARVMLFTDVPPGSSLLRDVSGQIALRVALAAGKAPVDSSTRVAWQHRLADRARAYTLPVARNTTNDTGPRITAYLALAEALESAHDTAGVDKAVAEAGAMFPADPIIAKLPHSVGSGQVLRVGAHFPNFRLSDLEGTHGDLTNESFKGKLTLVDFWGTWCSPCVDEIPYLHKAYEAFKSKGFSILSISSDESVDAVKRFRREKWPMPWVHGWSGPGIDTPALSAMGVMAFPTAVLVDADGKIVAMNATVRGDSLQLTLAHYLH